MHVTAYAEINALLDQLLAQIQHILGQKLTGLYLYGSLVLGDFDYDSSDIDLLAATSSDIDEHAFAKLYKAHDSIVTLYPHWQGRIEIAYASTDALHSFKSRTSQIAVMSPGEPFHFKAAGYDWLTNWYMVQAKGVTLFGPPPGTLIDPISQAEFIQAVRAQTRAWAEWIYKSQGRPSQAYAILTMCRALYTHTYGEQASKLQAATWTAQQLPQWAHLIQQALLWRAAWRDEVADTAATFPETLRFVQFIIQRITTT